MFRGRTSAVCDHHRNVLENRTSSPSLWLTEELNVIGLKARALTLAHRVETPQSLFKCCRCFTSSLSPTETVLWMVIFKGKYESMLQLWQLIVQLCSLIVHFEFSEGIQRPRCANYYRKTLNVYFDPHKWHQHILHKDIQLSEHNQCRSRVNLTLHNGTNENESCCSNRLSHFKSMNPH